MDANTSGNDLGAVLSVTGDIIPYSFANSETGEEVGLVHLRVPGDVVTVNVDPSIAAKMKEGERWTVVGLVVVRKKSGRMHISEPHSFKRIRSVKVAGGPTIDFGDDAPTPAQTRKSA